LFDVRLLVAASFARGGRVDSGFTDDREGGDLEGIVEGENCAQQGTPDSLSQMPRVSSFGTSKISSRHDALGFDQADEAVDCGVMRSRLESWVSRELQMSLVDSAASAIYGTNLEKHPGVTEMLSQVMPGKYR